MNVLNLLKKFSEEESNYLFQKPCLAFCIVQILPSLERKVIIFISQRVTVSYKLVNSLLKDDSQLTDKCLSNLRELNIIGDYSIPLQNNSIDTENTLKPIQMNSIFKQSLQKSITSGQICPFNIDRANSIESNIELHCKKCWEYIYNTYLNTAESSEKKSLEFLFLDLKQQTWRKIIDMLASHKENKTIHDTNINYIELLSLLLIFSQTPYQYKIFTKESWLTQKQRDYIPKLNSLGLLYFNVQEQYFAPTKLGISICSTTEDSFVYNPLLTGDDSLELYIETNFKIYVYTQNTIYKKLLTNIIVIETIFPNLMCGLITRDKILQAFKNGITADQICKFFIEFVKPEQSDILLNGNTNLKEIPDNVIDQIYLWEQEYYRIHSEEGYLIDNISSKTYYRQIRGALSDNMILWSSIDNSNKIVVTCAGYLNLQKENLLP